ncbi:MAG: DUF4330 domain-containing protein [Clostridia bacterium]|nr:DUF4330 domain-containing protein [Clostridia bacterium]
MTEENKVDKINKPKRKSVQGKEKKKRVGINILDILIILCITAVVALLFAVYSPWNLIKINSDEVAVIYTVRVSGVPSAYASNINIGDKASDPDGYELGVVASAVEVESHIMYIFDTNSGGVKPIEHPDLVDLLVTFSATATVSDDGYLINGKRIAVEGVYELLLPDFEAEGICISLSQENATEAGGAK